MKRIFWGLVIIFLLSIISTTIVLAAEYPIDFVLNKTIDFANKIITIRGVVSNSQTTNFGPFSKIKGEFDLTDRTGATIHVRTPHSPPANGVVQIVTGKLDIGTNLINPILIESSLFMPRNWMIYGGIVMVLILVVLIIVFIGKTGKNKPVFDYQRVVPTIGGMASSTTSEPGLAELVISESPNMAAGISFSLGRSKMQIGRSENMDIRLNDETVSRIHASVWWQDEAYYLQDEGSMGGTFINDQKITRHVLMEKDTITLGKTKLVFKTIPR